jgi:putative DNA primase/helicase
MIEATARVEALETIAEAHALAVFINPADEPPPVADEPEIDRPCFHCHDDWFQLNGERMKPGLYWHGIEQGKEGQAVETNTWICTPIHAEAVTRDDEGGNYGRLLRFRNTDGRWKEWAAPMKMLSGHGEELRGELLSYGLRYAPDCARLFNKWLMGAPPKPRIIAANRTGWHANGRAFVLPGRTIGNARVRFQAEQADRGHFRQAGTLAGWREQVAARCPGNPLLVLAVSTALAGPLILRAALQEQGGAGLHFVGDSSKGKTTALQAAASVWGGPDFVKTWRATSNGAEGVAASLSDTALILDELSESEPKEAGAVAYMLSNGQGKQRAKRDGSARASLRWRIMALSSGERTLGAHMAEGRLNAKAGQEARLLDIPATARRFGLFDNLHGAEDGRAFADAMKQGTGANFGHAGPAFVEALLDDARDLPALFAQARALPDFRAADGLESRAAGWFALIGLAGELATEAGITGWPEGEAMAAAFEGFRLWRDFRGAGNTETRRILEAVTAYLERYGDSRFSDLQRGEETRVNERAGWWRDTPDGGRVWLFNRPGLAEAGGGFDLKRITQALNEAGWIAERDSGRLTKKTRADGRTLNLYAVQPGGES